MTYPITTTLKALRQAGACYDGYNKLVCSLSGNEYDEERESYVRFKHTEEIPLAFVLESNGLDDALWALRASNISDRDARLFAVWCARQVQHSMVDERSINAIDVAEKFANGEATREELDAARAAAWAALDAAWDATRAAARAAAAWAAAMDAARATRIAAKATRIAARDAAKDAQKEMFLKMCRGAAPWQV
jgi:hypothetical protein